MVACFRQSVDGAFRLWPARTVAARAIQIGLSVSLLSVTVCSSQAQPRSEFVDALWVGESGGVLKIAAMGGGVLIQINAPPDVRGVAVDDRRGAVWLYSAGILYNFGFDGGFRFSTPLGGATVDDQDGRAALTVNPTNGDVWAAVADRLYRLDADGQPLNAFSLAFPVVDLVLDRLDSRLWIATVRTVGAIDESGRELIRLPLAQSDRPQDIDLDQGSGDVWVALKGALRRYGASGDLLAQVAVAKIERVADDRAGGAWLAADKKVQRLGPDLALLFELDPFGGRSATVDLLSHPLDSSAWIANKRQLAHVGAEGTLLRVLDFDQNQDGVEGRLPLQGRIFDLELYSDTIPPQISFVSPTDGSLLNDAFPGIEMAFDDIGLGVAPETLVLTADGNPISLDCVFEVDSAVCAPTARLPEGPVILTATVSDFNGNVSEPAQIEIVIDTVPPLIAFSSPTDGEILDDATPTISVSYSDSGSGVNLASYRTLLNGVDVTAGASVGPTGATYTPAGPLPSGPNGAAAEIADLAGNTASAVVMFTVTSGFRAIADCAPTSGPAPLTVRFRSRGEFPGGSIVRYRWDFFGDGSYDVTSPVARDYTRTYFAAGTFEAVLEVTNNLGETATDSCTIQAGGNAPVAMANASPSNGPVPLAVELTCTATDRDGGIVLYEWDFEGDGVFDYSSPTNGRTVHTYTETGRFVAVCRVTDNDGMTDTARATTTVIEAGPPGSPSVEANASPAAGNAPLNVSLNGSATDDGVIVLWEWDFEGDGVFDFSSPSSPATSHVYVNGGIFAARLRVTDDSGLTSSDTVEIIVNLTATLSIPDDTFDPVAGETAQVATSISAGLPVRIFIQDQEGSIVRTLIDEFRPAGTYSDSWDGRDDSGDPLPQAPYYAILEYDFFDEVRTVDLTNTTGGVSYNPSRNSLPSVFRPFEDNLLTVNFTIPESRGASEIQAFVGLFRVDTRFITLLERVPLGTGGHTIQWDGLDPSGNPAIPPPGDSFLFGIIGLTLPDNAIFLQSAPRLSAVAVDPNIFDPSTPNFLSPDSPTATVRFNLDRTADVELAATNLATGVVVRTIRRIAVQPGANAIEWDGRADNGLFVASGVYRLSIQAADSAGSRSLTRFALMRVFH